MSFLKLFLLLVLLVFSAHRCYAKRDDNSNSKPSCRSYCGNITVDYPFATKQGCGHPGFKELLYCINNVLMIHIPSGSYRVLEIDYAYQALTLDDPHLSTCDNIILGSKGNGFMVNDHSSYQLTPDPDNVFLLIGCSSQSPLFQGFPNKHLTCRNISSTTISCKDYYRCPAWGLVGPKEMGSVYGSGPPECCAVSFQSIKAINLTKLGCQGYSSAYTLAPLKLDDPRSWSYGIRVRYDLRGEQFCKACEATGGVCGFGSDEDKDKDKVDKEMCLCGTWNSTTNCDTEIAENLYSSSTTRSLPNLKSKWLMSIFLLALWTIHQSL